MGGMADMIKKKKRKKKTFLLLRKTMIQIMPVLLLESSVR